MEIPFDIPFILTFALTTVVVAGVLGKGVMNLLSIKDPVPPASTDAS